MTEALERANTDAITRRHLARCPMSFHPATDRYYAGGLAGEHGGSIQLWMNSLRRCREEATSMWRALSEGTLVGILMDEDGSPETRMRAAVASLQYLGSKPVSSGADRRFDAEAEEWKAQATEAEVVEPTAV